MGKELKPFVSIGPGEHIREEIETRGWSVEEFADRLCLSAKHVSEILNDKKPISIETAKLLSEVFGTSAQFWMNLYTNYIFSKTQDTESNKEVILKARVYEIMPISDMVKKGWIEKPETTAELLTCVKKIWGTDIINDILKEIHRKSLPAFRKTEKDAFSYNYSQTWLKVAENISGHYKVPLYNPKAFEELCERGHEYTLKENGIEAFIKEVNKSGVKFFVLPHLTKTYIDGAVFMDKGNPVIVYTGRYDRIDNFWFTFIHEAGHVIKHLHKEKDAFIDDLSKISGEKEKEADEYSKEKLKITEILAKFDQDSPTRVAWISSTSSLFQISPAIIVGALQHAGKISYRSKMLNSLKESVLDKISEIYIPNVKRLCS
ncbi:MAG: addiction module antidote protein, HigA family [Candidatus Firestonebacteria bacterium RIFOXYA2_FULL_40_8]|nr:MAG: addiction module antidote protein, HigA family [Candidatus Firestonebacteria bacterium RIFOXYA2_FULL_40_8]